MTDTFHIQAPNLYKIFSLDWDIPFLFTLCQRFKLLLTLNLHSLLICCSNIHILAIDHSLFYPLVSYLDNHPTFTMLHLTAANTAIGSIVFLHQKGNNYKHTCVHECTIPDQKDNNKLKPVILKSIAYNHPAVVLDLDYSKPEPWAIIATITHKLPKGFKSLPITGNPGTQEMPATGPLQLEERNGIDEGLTSLSTTLTGYHSVISVLGQAVSSADYRNFITND